MITKTEISLMNKFIHQLSKLKFLTRASNNPLVKDKDTVASHSWRSLVLALFADDFVDQKIDQSKIISMLIVHDLVEIQNDEVVALGFRNDAQKKEKELSEDLSFFSYLPPKMFNKIQKLWIEFRDQTTLESKLAKAIENFESNVSIIESVEAIKDPHHKELTINYIKRRLGIDSGLDKVIEFQLNEIEEVSKS